MLDEAYLHVSEHLERIQAWIGGGGGDEAQSSGSGTSSSSSTSRRRDGSRKDGEAQSSSSSTSAVVWWLTSLLLGVSTSVVYHLVRDGVLQKKIKVCLSGDSTGSTPDFIADQGGKLVVWARKTVFQVERMLTEKSPSEVTLQVALGTSFFLPDHLTVPWVLGCLVVSRGLWPAGRLARSPLDIPAEKYPPYLFLCFCPGMHRFQLWLTWMGLQLMDSHRVVGSYRGPPPRSQDSATYDTKRKTRGSGKHGIPYEEKTSTLSDAKESTRSRYLEVLVHNVSHTDIILGLDPLASVTEKASSADDPYCLCRPRFSFMDVYCRMVLEALTEKENIMEFPRYERSEEDPRFAIKDMSTGVPTPAGLGLMPDPSLMANLADLRVRGRDHAKLDGENETAPWTASPRDKDKAPSKFPINFIFFPLLATLLPSWKAQIEERQYPRNVRRVLILVTGVGTPRNWTHSVSGNSTEVCATLMERFLQRVDPDLTVVKIHSDTNIFRYDDNLRFVDKEFAPVMNAWRDAHAKGMPYPGERIMAGANANPFNADWRNSMSVTLSSADGSSARTHAIRESLRPFRPTFFHFWQLKTFWHEFKIVDNDIEVHSYETMETSPAVDAERLRDPHAQMVVNEMKAFREEMIETLRRGQHDISKFWLRKTHKPVLAVLLVQSHGSTKPVLYRGTNMEVSMPTGSLCAERNVIGSALAANPELKREDLKLIAVLAIPTLEDLTAEPTLKRVASAASVGSIPSSSGERRNSVGSEVEQPGDWILSTDQQQPTGLDQSFAMVADETKEDNESTPVRKIRLFSKSARHQNRRSVVVQNSRDLNPLAPCGACNEWLKKISESNPYFTILTFTDAECHGVYCTPCQQ